MKLVFLSTFITALVVEITGLNTYGSTTNRYGFFDGSTSFSQPPSNFVQNVKKQIPNNRFCAYAYSSTKVNSNAQAQAKSSLTFKTKSKNEIVPSNCKLYYNLKNFKSKWSTINPHSFRDNFPVAFATVKLGAKTYQHNGEIFSPYMNASYINSIGKPPVGNNYGIYTSTYSISSNVNGKAVAYQQSSTTVNDGKIKTKTIRYP